MPVPPSPLLENPITPPDWDHITDHEAIADALNNDTASLTADQTLSGITALTRPIIGGVAWAPTPTGNAATDTAAVQSRLDALPATGGKVILQPTTSGGLSYNFGRMSWLHDRRHLLRDGVHGRRLRRTHRGSVATVDVRHSQRRGVPRR